VSPETAKTLGTIKTEESYDSSKECITFVNNGGIKESLRALWSFSKALSFEPLKEILENDDESDRVRHDAAIAVSVLISSISF
jgi:hypothetical protein